MSKTLVKPRWETWENSCLQTAFSDKIQQKIVAIALGRSATSVNKKITNLGLRSPSTLRRRRRIGGEKQFLSQEEKTPQDLEKMIKILETYAPLHSFQEGCFALKNGFWTQSKEFLQTDQNKGDHLGGFDLHNCPFSFVKHLDFIPSREPVSEDIRIKKIPGDPAYVSLFHVEKWAEAEGFHKTKGVLQHRGLSYWKDGNYFSKTQLLMHVNRLRFEQNLQPITLIEEEWESPA